MTYVYYTRIHKLKNRREYYERAKKIIPPGEITAKEGTGAWAESVTAHMLIRYLLLDRYLIFDGIRVERTESGKPYLVSPAGFHLSLAHGGGIAACAVSAATPVGVDVQLVGKIPPLVLERLFAPAEREFVNVGCEGDAERFAFIWTRKESYVKMTGEGITHDISKIDTVTGENTDGAVFATEKVGKKILTLCTATPVKTEFYWL